jgi:hypothetical protein
MIRERGFELHPDGRVDLALAVADRDELAQLAAQHDWPSIARLAGAWPSFVPAICLELDEGRVDIEPSAFFRAGDAHGHEAGSVCDWTPAWLDVIATLRGSPLNCEIHATLTRCCAAIPSRARLHQVGVMTARATDAIRLCITNFAPDEVVPYLARIGWNGNAARTSPLLAIAAAHDSLLTLHLDAGAQLASRIGIEIAPRFPNDDTQWPRHLAAFAHAQLLDETMARAVEQWPDADGAHRISHLKVVFDGDAVLTKAYLGTTSTSSGTSIPEPATRGTGIPSRPNRGLRFRDRSGSNT